MDQRLHQPGEMRMIPIDQIEVLNSRERNSRVFEEIVANIKTIGLKKPVTVTERPNDDGTPHYVLVCGEGRLKAFRALGQVTIPALVVSVINLQHLFTAVVHYDLAWNPTRHEQREGRVDRFGQQAADVRCSMLWGQDICAETTPNRRPIQNKKANRMIGSFTIISLSVSLLFH